MRVSLTNSIRFFCRERLPLDLTVSPCTGRNDQAFDLLLRESRLLNIAENNQANAAVNDTGEVGLGRHV